ncbi:transcriptional activator Hap3p [Trichomonascus vanleenenianus]|uniref:nuclear transcription factor Y subunit beta n=1 Tax=Trichomonascus vanleenenianus TaxID=2268995 RepID=UPI003EC9D34C
MSDNSTGEAFGREYELREQDKWLPIANVARIMKTALPDNAKVSKEAKECVQECVSEFVSFITSEASEKCIAEKRKTVNGEDILFAMTSLGFENYSEVLKIYLAKYRQSQQQESKKKRSPHADKMTESPELKEESSEPSPVVKEEEDLKFSQIIQDQDQQSFEDPISAAAAAIYDNYSSGQYTELGNY